jgi:lysophospholipid hydrolase
MTPVQVIVVDVEDRDDSVWQNLTPLDGGLSGWRLLWDRWCPIPSLRQASLSALLALSFWAHSCSQP